MAGKDIRTGVQAGAVNGTDAPYVWSVGFLAIARAEAEAFLSPEQYHHVVDQVRSLAREQDPTHPATVSVSQIEDYYELREKGGPLNKINFRGYFILDNHRRTIVFLCGYKKEDDGATPNWIKLRVRMRRRRYIAGEYSRI